MPGGLLYREGVAGREEDVGAVVADDVDVQQGVDAGHLRRGSAARREVRDVTLIVLVVGQYATGRWRRICARGVDAVQVQLRGVVEGEHRGERVEEHREGLPRDGELAVVVAAAESLRQIGSAGSDLVGVYPCARARPVGEPDLGRGDPFERRTVNRIGVVRIGVTHRHRCGEHELSPSEVFRVKWGAPFSAT